MTGSLSKVLKGYGQSKTWPQTDNVWGHVFKVCEGLTP